jgi:hypothetical protein
VNIIDAIIGGGSSREDFVIVRKAPKCPVSEMHVHKMSLHDGMGVSGSALSSSAIEFAADETGVNVGGVFERHGARVVGGVEV